MILLTVGTQLPFDRLVKQVDIWAGAHAKEPVKAQIGPSDYKPEFLDCFDLIGPDEFRHLQRSARVIIAHAGMGSIMTAMEFGVPIIIMPRLARWGEHRNDHQLATARQFKGAPGVYLAEDETQLTGLLDRIDELSGAQAAGAQASSELLDQLRAYIDGVAVGG